MQLFHNLFSEDCEKIKDPCFSLFNDLAPYFLTVMNHLSISFKKSIISNKAFINLSCGIVLYKVEISKHAMDVTLPWLILFIECITGLLFNIVQKDFLTEKKVLCLLQDSIFLQIHLKAGVIHFGSGFKEHFGATFMNLALFGFLCSLRIQYTEDRS